MRAKFIAGQPPGLTAPIVKILKTGRLSSIGVPGFDSGTPIDGTDLKFLSFSSDLNYMRVLYDSVMLAYSFGANGTTSSVIKHLIAQVTSEHSESLCLGKVNTTSSYSIYGGMCGASGTRFPFFSSTSVYSYTDSFGVSQYTHSIYLIDQYAGLSTPAVSLDLHIKLVVWG